MGTGGGLVVIDFSARGNSAYFRHDGWSGQEPDRVWGIGPRCVLRVPLQTSGVAFVLEVELGPCHAPPEIAGQIVRLRVNGAAIGWARLDAQAMIRCEIDTSIANRDGTQDIEFEFPGFYQPKMLGPSNDSRPLSAWFSFARLYTTDMFRPGPHFPASHPDIPVIGLYPPLAEPEPARTTAAPEVYTFGTAGKGETFLRDGWRHDGDSLNAAAALAQIALPAPVTTGPCMLRLDVWPPAGAEEGQDIILTLDRIVIGQLNLAEPATWVVPLPRELLPERGGDLNLGFLSSALRVAGEPGDAAPGFRLERISIVPRPASLPAPSVARDGHAAPATVARWFQSDDAAALPAATEAALGMDVVTLARGFESLGTTAEFGVAQRNLGLEVVNFFRFCDIPLPGLLRALSDDLRAATDPARIAIERAGAANPVLTVAAYNLRWPVSADPDRTASPLDHAMTLGYLRRKFFEGLRAGRKIHVISRRRAIPVGQALALLMELHRHGPATLLCVEQDAKRAGEVDVLMPGLMRGYMAALAPDTFPPGASPEPVDTIGWWRLMANAALTRRRARPAEAA